MLNYLQGSLNDTAILGGNAHSFWDRVSSWIRKSEGRGGTLRPGCRVFTSKTDSRCSCTMACTSVPALGRQSMEVRLCRSFRAEIA